MSDMAHSVSDTVVLNVLADCILNFLNVHHLIFPADTKDRKKNSLIAAYSFINIMSIQLPSLTVI